MANKLALNDFMAIKHRLLNTYVHCYKEKLCLNNDGEDPIAKANGGFALTVDFNEMVQLR